MKIALCIVALVAATSQAASLVWTGYAHNNQWDTPVNWYPDIVPGINDDVVINYGDVQAPQVAFVKTLVMGSNTSSVSLTIFNKFTIASSLTVGVKGDLVLASGGTLVNGNVQIDGSLTFQSGTISGAWTVSPLGVAHLESPGQKSFSACTFTCNGPLGVSGSLSLNNSATFRQIGVTVASGSFAVRAEDSASTFKADEAPNFTFSGSSFLLQAPARFGQFSLTGAMTIFGSAAFTGPVAIVGQGSTLQTVAAAVVSFSGAVSGAGSIVALGNSITFGQGLSITGGVKLAAGTVNFNAPTTVDHFNFTGGAAAFSGSATARNLLLQSGSAQGSGTLLAATASIDGAGFKVGMRINFTSVVSVASPSQLVILPSSGVVLMSSATLSVGNSLLITGLMPNNGINNDGTVTVAAASLTTQNVDLRGIGSVNIATQFDMTNARILQYQVSLTTPSSKFSGHSCTIQHITAVRGSPFVDAVVGDFDLLCPMVCDNLSTAGLPGDNFIFTVSATAGTPSPNAILLKPSGQRTH